MAEQFCFFDDAPVQLNPKGKTARKQAEQAQEAPKPKILKKALARATDPRTSHVAAGLVDVARLEGMVVDVLREQGPMSTCDIADHLGMDRDSISPRMRPLEAKKLAHKNGDKSVNKNNRRCIVWAIGVANG